MGIDDWSAWMTKAQQGDQEAYKALLAEIYPAIQNFLRSKLGPLGATEDMVQECVLAIHKVRSSYDPQREFRPWMYAVVRNKLIDILRKQGRIQKKEVANSEIVETYSEDDSYTGQEESSEAVHKALEALPEEMRRAVVLTKIKGLSTKEAAESEGISEAAIRTRISRAYVLLRKLLEKEIGW